MQICFLSNYFNHHQKPVSDAFYKITSGRYFFIATSEISEWRKKLGYKEMSAPYVLDYNKENTNGYIDDIILNSDIVIWGAADRKLVKKRLQQGKLTFLCTERIYWQNIPWYRFFSHYVKFGFWYRRFKNLFLLCASAYTSKDFLMTGTFRDKAFKWGYFPQTIQHEVEALVKKKEEINTQKGFVSILWVGRLIDWKHPESILILAEELKNKGYSFKISVIGIGELESSLKNTIDTKNLSKEIELLGSMSPEEVRRKMEASSIFISTSDAQEGWGVVLNEAMNSACAVVASNAMGSAPYLIVNGHNGLLFDSLDWASLIKHVELLLSDAEIRRRLAMNAYNTIFEEWNAQTAASRLVTLSKEIQLNNDTFTCGPCSKA